MAHGPPQARARSSRIFADDILCHQFQVPSVVPPLPGGTMEIVFSFDTTGSMYSCLEQVRQKVAEMVKRLQREIPGIRIAVIAHGDYCDGPNVVTIMDFSNNEKMLCDFVMNIPKTTGGDEPECYELILNEVRERLSWTPGTQRSLVMIGDATPHPPTDPQNYRRLDWKLEAMKLHNHLGVRIYAVQALNNPVSDSFYQTLASLTGGHHLRLDDFSSIVDFMMAICFREQSVEQLKAYEDEVRKRGSGVSSSIQKLFDELRTTHSGSRARIPLLTRRILEHNDQLLRLQRVEIEQRARELCQPLEEHDSSEEQREEEWQDTRKELKEQHNQLKLLTDLLQSNQRRQLSEALGLPEEQPSEVLEAHVTSEKGKVAVTETNALVTRQEHLAEYQIQARDVAGRLLNYEDQLHSHIVVLNERKEVLAELESCGEKYTEEVTECNQQLEQLQEKLGLTQAELRSCKEKLQECKEQLEECLDEMSKCEVTLRQSQLELTRFLDTLEKLRENQTDELSNLDQKFQSEKQIRDVLKQRGSHLVGYYDGWLEGKKAELQKCRKELEATERTLKRCKDTLQESEKTKLGKLKECVEDPQPTSTIAASCTQLHQNTPTDDGQCKKSSSICAQVTKERESIVEFLSCNVDPEGFATELEIIGLINKDIREEAEVATITTRKRIRPVIKAVITKLELSEENADKFKIVLKKFRLLDDLMHIIT